MMDQRTLSDEELVLWAQQGKLDAFTTLYERYFPIVYNRVRYLIPENDVSDVTQEVFIAVMKSLKSFRCESLFRTWLRTILQRQVANYYRQRGPDTVAFNQDDCLSEDDEPYTPIRITEDDCPNLDDRIILNQALRSIPCNYREILLLRFAEGMQFNEIAKQQGQSLEATKSLFRRAVAALHKQVDEAHA